MADIKSPTLLYAKGAMMLVVGILASVLLLLRHPRATTALLLAVAVWGFCRALLLRLPRYRPLHRPRLPPCWVDRFCPPLPG